MRTARRGGEQAVGFKHLAFEVPDLEASIAKLRAAGIEPGEIIDAGAQRAGPADLLFQRPGGQHPRIDAGLAGRRVVTVDYQREVVTLQPLACQAL